VERLADDEALHRCLLAYVSDFHLLDTALKPHGISMISPKLVIASVDHAMWFHRSVRVDDWLLYAMDSPSASGARGLTRGSRLCTRRPIGGKRRAGRVDTGYFVAARGPNVVA